MKNIQNRQKNIKNCYRKFKNDQKTNNYRLIIIKLVIKSNRNRQKRQKVKTNNNINLIIYITNILLILWVREPQNK